MINSAVRVIREEISALEKVVIDDKFACVCETLLGIRGHIILTGMGKSGHIARKISATLASTGSPSFFLHPGEAGHGDLGMITKNDAIVALSNSGNTQEIVGLVPLIKRLKIPLISFLNNANSVLAEESDVFIDIGVEREACPLAIAPTTTTTVMLVLGDALAITLLEERGFTKDDFALLHPNGVLGKKLLLKVKDVMRSGDLMPVVKPYTPVSDVLVEMTTKGLGIAVVVEDERILGVFTDGDIRRTLMDKPVNAVIECLSWEYKHIGSDCIAVKALNMMQESQITCLVVKDDERLVGVLHLHDLLKAGVV